MHFINFTIVAASGITINHAGSVLGTFKKPSGLSVSISLNSFTSSGQKGEEMHHKALL